MKFCEFCGKQLERKEKCTCEQAVAKLQQPKKYNQKLYYTIGVVVVALVLLFTIVISTTSKVDPFDYTTVSFEGYDSIGKININFSKVKLIEDIIGPEPQSFEELAKWMEKYDALSSNIDYTVTPNKNLSNGDIVEVRFTVESDSKNKISTKSKKFTVSGLKEVETFDVFANIDVSFEGVSGEAEVNIKKTRSDIMDCCQLDIEPYNELKNGNKVVITVHNIDAMADQFGVVPKETTKDYIVSNLALYVAKKSQLDQKIIKDFETKFLKEQKEKRTDNFIFSYKNFKNYAVYFISKKETDTSNREKNLLLFFVSYDEYTDGELRNTIYTPLIFKNIMVNKAGELSIVYEEGDNSTFTTNIDTYFDKFKENYVIEKIK